MEEFNITEWLHSDSEDKSQVSQDPANPVGNVPEKVLTVQEVRVLNYVEQVFWETGLYPTPEGIVEGLGVSRAAVSKAFSNETFRTQLAARGMEPEALVTVGHLVPNQNKVLSAKQIVCANLMLNLHDKRSEREKLALIQVSSQQYHAWLRQPAFIEFLRKRGEALFSASDFHAYKSLVNNVKAGDNKSLELFFKMRGIYRPEVNINLNIDAVLNQVVEVITRYVKDPLVLQAIAGELESIIDVEAVG